MKTQAHQLPQLLQKGLSPVYLVSGDEPLLVQECCDQIRKTAREAAMSQSEFFSYHMHLLASTYAEQMGMGMQEIEEGAQIRGQEAEDLGLPELHDPGLQSVEADYDLMMVDIHVQYCLMERAATTHTMCAGEEDGSLVSIKHSVKHSVPVSQKLLFLDGFSRSHSLGKVQ